jgi:hypothetical protein
MRAGFPGNLLGRQVEHEGDLHGFEGIGSLKHVPEYVCLQQERVLGRPVLDRLARLGEGAELLDSAPVTRNKQ